MTKVSTVAKARHVTVFVKERLHERVGLAVNAAPAETCAIEAVSAITGSCSISVLRNRR
jgi:hypothetical protein